MKTSLQSVPTLFMTYNGWFEPRREGEDWLHWLLRQDFTAPIFLKEMEKLTYRIKSKLLFCENKMGKDYTPICIPRQ
jgi:hypothetical protein